MHISLQVCRATALIFCYVQGTLVHIFSLASLSRSGRPLPRDTRPLLIFPTSIYLNCHTVAPAELYSIDTQYTTPYPCYRLETCGCSQQRLTPSDLGTCPSPGMTKQSSCQAHPIGLALRRSYSPEWLGHEGCWREGPKISHQSLLHHRS